VPVLDDRGSGDSFCTTVFRPALGPTHPPVQWVLGALFTGVERPGREADRSLLSSAEVNAWSYTSTPPIRLHGVVLSEAQAQLYPYYLSIYTFLDSQIHPIVARLEVFPSMKFHFVGFTLY
jgi:hypothetical protein